MHIWKKLFTPFSTIKKWCHSPQKKIKASIQKKRQLLIEEVTRTLDSDSSLDVGQDIDLINHFDQILEMQETPFIIVCIKAGAISILILILLTIIPTSLLPSLLSSPGFIEVNTNAIEMTLTEDFDWSGSISTAEGAPLILSRFSDIDSLNPPELSAQISSSLFQIEPAGKGELKSLFIPKGAKLWLEWDRSNHLVTIVIGANSPTTPQDKTVHAAFKLNGRTRFIGIDNEIKVRNPLPCPFDEKCTIPRSAIVSTPLDKTPSLQLQITSPLIFSGLEVNNISFSKHDNTDQKKRIRCTIINGRLQLQGDTEPRIIHKGECIHVRSKKGIVRIEKIQTINNKGNIMQTTSPDQGFQVWYRGDTQSVKIGTQKFTQELTPNLLVWLATHPTIKFITAIAATLLAAFAGIVIVRVRK